MKQEKEKEPEKSGEYLVKQRFPTNHRQGKKVFEYLTVSLFWKDSRTQVETNQNNSCPGDRQQEVPEFQFDPQN